MGERDKSRKAAVCIVVENMCVPRDPRVWREAQVLRREGYAVSIVCPREPGFERSRETIDGVDIYRHGRYEGQGIFGHFVEYLWALLAEFALVLRVYAKTRFTILQACNPPDTIFLIAMFFRPFGVRFIFDQHDPMPEFCEARYGKRKLLYRLVCLAERLTFASADAVLVTNSSCRKLAVTRGGVSPERCFVVRNCPALDAFPSRRPDRNLKEGMEYLVVYVGVMGSQDGIELLLDSIDCLVHEKGRRDTLFVLIGGGPERAKMQQKAAERGLDGWVKFTGPLYGDALRAYVAVADVGVSPDPFNLFNDQLTMIKILEYMACGLPVVMYDLKEGRRSAAGAALYARRNDPVDFAAQIALLLDSEPLRRRLGEAGKRRIRDGLNWEREQKTLLDAYTAATGLSEAVPAEPGSETFGWCLGAPAVAAPSRRQTVRLADSDPNR